VRVGRLTHAGRRLFWPATAAGLLLAAFDVVDGYYVAAPLLGLAIWRVGTATLGSLAAGARHVPDGPPTPVDPRLERIVYRCDGCGAELQLLVRGADVPPRHCGERMTERREVSRELLS
jgi:DNA-directed RNA polymerase subunit RPC12/RpoP